MPVPIIVPVTPVGKAVLIPPRIVSAVTAVSASKGVGAGRISPTSVLLYLALTCTVSISVTVTSIYAWLALLVVLGASPVKVILAASVACSGIILTVSLRAHPSPPCNNTASML